MFQDFHPHYQDTCIYFIVRERVEAFIPLFKLGRVQISSVGGVHGQPRMRVGVWFVVVLIVCRNLTIGVCVRLTSATLLLE